MHPIGVQTKNVVNDTHPEEGFALLGRTGFSCADFSLNGYLLNTSLYEEKVNAFFDKSTGELEKFFTPHRQGAIAAGITISQMHMPYPNYVPRGSRELNAYLRNVVAPKSLAVCAFFDCPYLVVHGFKLAYFMGSEEEEWKETEKFLDFLAPMAKEMGITLCIENLYEGLGNHLVEGPCCRAEKAVERIDRMNDKYQAQVLGFCFDTGHANLVGLDFESFLMTLGHRLKVLHIHDNDGVADLHQIPFTFTQTRENLPSTDWEGFLRGLQSIGYQGALSFETAPVLTAFPQEMKAEALSFIARIGHYFASQLLPGAQAEHRR
ncbi:MAG: sugar phosphate isomerase/epimerase [Lachnospiraceae bacterium]|jgi:sugar phosphate isomerase/epimerase|nr:sugar phosphate isomerase/epimerase [Lachnospiraceae bacterium]